MIWAINQPINHAKLLRLQCSLQHYLPPSVSPYMLFAGIFDGANWDKDNVFKISEMRRGWFLEKSHTGCAMEKKVVCLLPVWKAFIQLIFSLQGKSKIGMHFSGKLLELECPDCQPLLLLLQADCQLVSACSGKAGNTKILGRRLWLRVPIHLFPANGKIK